MDISKVSDLEVSGKKVLVRMDLDVPGEDYTRPEAEAQTLDYLKAKNAEIIIIGHRGRPGGKVDENLSLRVFQPFFDRWEVRLEENLRFNPGEEKNDPEFARSLSSLGEIYVNEAFAVSHREHASIVGLPKLLPHAAGFRFVSEVDNLSKVIQNPRRPVVVIISGVKEDKVEMAERLTEKFDKVLVGGKLPTYFADENPKPEKLVIGSLTFDGFDITLNTIQKFKEDIAKAGTIVLAGVLGKYEDQGHIQGTKEIFEAVANSSAYKVAGGGDTISAIDMFNLEDKFDWISVGGGAMLEFLIKGTLPGIEALQ